MPISHFANICYLPEFENRVKRANNFYQDTEYLTKSGTTLELIEEKYSFTKKEDLEFMDMNFANGDFDILREYYIEFLKNRNERLKKKFLVSLGFSDEEESVKYPIETKKTISFDDRYFRTTKIAILVKETFDYLSKNDLLKNEDISNLKDKTFSKKLGIWLPILQTNYEDTFDKSGKSRYYDNTIEINGNQYYLCKEWKEEMRNQFVAWVKVKMNIN